MKKEQDKMIKYSLYGIILLVLFTVGFFFYFSFNNEEEKEIITSRNVNLVVGNNYYLNITNINSWESSNLNVAIVSNEGNIYAIGDGDTVITVNTSDEVISFNVHVESKNTINEVQGIKFDKNTLDMEINSTYKMNVRFIPSDTSSDLSWYSSNNNVAVVNNGTIKAVGSGTCMITVKTINGSSDTCLVKVNGKIDNDEKNIEDIKFDVESLVLKKGIEYILNYETIPKGYESLIKWDSSDKSVAVVENGVIKTINQGVTTLTASYKNVESILYLTVVDSSSDSPDVIDDKIVNVSSISLNQENISLNVNDSYRLIASVLPNNATDKKVFYESSNSAIVSVSSDGYLYALAKGSAKITASTSNGIKAYCNVTVSENSTNNQSISLNLSTVSLNVGGKVQLVETITPNNNVSNVTWSSSDNSVATVDNGLVTARKVGTAIITAKLSNGKSAKTTINVTNKTINVISLQMNASKVNLKVGGSSQLSVNIVPSDATNKTITWSSSNSNIASVNSNGNVVGKSSGTAIITAKSSNGITAKSTIVVTDNNNVTNLSISKSSLSLEVGKSYTLSVTVSPSSLANSVTWYSNNTSIATVNNGIVTAKKVGKTTIVASVSGKSVSCTVEVKSGSSGQTNTSNYSEGPGGSNYSKTITYNNRTYKVFKQRYFRDYSFWDGGNLADNGCAPVALSIILSGYFSNISPVDVGDYMEYGSFYRVAETAKHYGFTTNDYIYYNSNSNDVSEMQSIANTVRNHLKKGYPVIALVDVSTKCTPSNKYSGASHFIAILGEKTNGDLIVGNPGLMDGTGTIEDMLKCYMQGARKGFLLLTPPSNK